jgi:hypothetical protein
MADLNTGERLRPSAGPPLTILVVAPAVYAAGLGESVASLSPPAGVKT